MKRLDEYKGRVAAIEGHVVVDSHGVHLIEPGCEYEFNLDWRDDSVPGARGLEAMLDRVRAEKLMLIVRAIGEVKDEPAVNADGSDNLMGLIGPYIDLARIKVLSRQSLSRQEWRSYRDWLDDPRGDPWE